MTKHFRVLVGAAGGLLLGAPLAVQAQATLGTSPYTETFDNLGSGLPTGFGVYTAATASALGTAATAPTAQALWGDTGGGFKNFASADGLTSSASAADQSAATDRALGVRQTGGVGDPGAAFTFQVANTTGKTDFSLSFKLQSLDAASPRVTTWQVDYGLGSAPTSFTVVGTGSTTGGSTFSNNTVTVSFSSALDNQSGPVTIRIVALAGSTGTGNRPSTGIDDFALSFSQPTATSPNLTVTPSALSFGSQNISTTSAAQRYSLSGVNLTGSTTLTATGPFTISKDNVAFGSTLSYQPADLASTQSVYVRFMPTATGAATGSVSNASAGATTRTVALAGTGADPNQTVFDFANCTGTTTLSDGWTQYSVTGAQTWACTTFGHQASDPTASAPNGVQINGYSGGNVANEDWFISPAFNLSAYNYPLLQFWSRTAFNGPALKLRVSTNYSGTGAPSAATWTDLNAQFPAVGSDIWTQSALLNLSAYKNATVYVAFVYTSTTSAAARWTLDDISLTNSATAPTPTLFTDVTRLAFGYQAVGTSGTRSLTVSANDLTGNVTLTLSSAAYTLSKDGTTFGSTLALTPAEVSGTSKAVTVRFAPTAASSNYAGTIAVASPGATSTSVSVSGDTYDVTKTLEVSNWNMEWFGSTVSGQGPSDVATQQANATIILKGLAADVYVLEEAVDTTRLRNAVTDLSAALGVPYGIKEADFGSFADDYSDPDWAGDQKVTFVYRKDVVRPVTFSGLLRCTQTQACAAYTPWASGRFPFLMTADVTLDGTTRRINFIGIHAKANATATSPNDWQRRKDGADMLKVLLDASYAGQNTLILGDYNDVLNGTIATGVTPAVSSYSSLVNDPNYTAITLPLANAGAQSTVSYNTLIDNVIATKQMANYYIAGSAAVRTDLAATVANYGSTTSDHYPVYTRYSLTQQALAAHPASTAKLGLYPNPVGNAVRFEVPETGTLSLQVVGLDGRLVLQGTGTAEQLNQQLSERVAGLSSGLYLVRVVGQQQTYVDRFEKL